MNSIIRNYKFEWVSARDTEISPIKHDTTRLEIIAPLVKQAVEWGLELSDKAAVPVYTFLRRSFWEEMLSGKYPVDEARALCFSHLYGVVTGYSNAILRLIEDSYGSVAFGLLRSVMEVYAKCHYISKSVESRQAICHDYIAISHMVERNKELYGGAKPRQRNDMPSMVEALKERKERLRASTRGQDVEVFNFTPALKEELTERFKSFPHPLAWVHPDSKKRKSMASIIEDADKKYAKLYRLSNPAVHGNYSGAPTYAVLGFDTPERYIPYTPWGEGAFFKDPKELEIDFCVIEMLVRVMELAPRFLPLEDSLTERAITLAESGNDVFAKLKGT